MDSYTPEYLKANEAVDLLTQAARQAEARVLEARVNYLQALAAQQAIAAEMDRLTRPKGE